MLVVEVDGDIHNLHEQKEYDCIRTTFLNERNIKVVRLTNDEVLYTIDGALKRLEREILAPPLAPPNGGGTIGSLPLGGMSLLRNDRVGNLRGSGFLLIPPTSRAKRTPKLSQ